MNGFIVILTITILLILVLGGLNILYVNPKRIHRKKKDH